jgi:hypothetical protein
LFLLLLLLNLLFLAWARWIGAPATVQGHATPASDDRQAIRLLRESPAAGDAGRASGGIVGGSSVTCVSGGPFLDRMAAEQAAQRLGQLGFASRLRQSRDDIWVGQWVRVENLATADDASNVIAALEAAGIDDAYALTDEGPGNVVSLGVFSDPARAAEVAALAARIGLATRAIPRVRAEDVFWIDVDRQANAGLPSLEALQGSGGAPTRLELRPCPVSPAGPPVTGGP